MVDVLHFIDFDEISKGMGKVIRFVKKLYEYGHYYVSDKYSLDLEEEVKILLNIDKFGK